MNPVIDRSADLRTLCATLLLAVVFASPGVASATWVSVSDLDGGEEICLDVGGRQFEYTRIAPGEAASVSVRGPRRLKLITRYLFTADDDTPTRYTVRVTVDGREVLKKVFTGQPLDTVARCEGDGAVASLRKDTWELPRGEHTVAVTCETAGSGAVAIRLFREVKRTRNPWVPFTPASYGEVRELEFASGSRSTYYTLDAAQPLRLTIHGPTRVRVRHRLDFDHRMSGSQNYTLEVCRDGESWRTFHFDSTKLETAVYVDRPDILPGSRRELTIEVPRGRHELSIHCVRPEACGVAVTLAIPQRDVER
jgi:hypothetical protein